MRSKRPLRGCEELKKEIWSSQSKPEVNQKCTTGHQGKCTKPSATTATRSARSHSNPQRVAQCIAATASASTSRQSAIRSACAYRRGQSFFFYFLIFLNCPDRHTTSMSDRWATYPACGERAIETPLHLLFDRTNRRIILSRWFDVMYGHIGSLSNLFGVFLFQNTRYRTSWPPLL